jgi:hypothetical protein
MMPFIGSPATQELPPPFSFKDVEFNYFEVEFPLAAQERFCNTYLNIGPLLDRRYWFTPLLPIGFFGVVKYAKMFSDQGSFAQYGFVAQNEVCFIFPLLRIGITPANLLDWEISWACPFIAVDSATSAFTGREVLGFRKLYGSIVVNPQGQPSDGSFSAEVKLPAFRTFSPESPQEILPVVHIKTGPKVRNGGENTVDTFLGAMLQHDRVRSGLETATKAASVNAHPKIMSVAPLLRHLDPLSLIPEEMSVVNLKQIRDGQDSSQAAYQALVGCRFVHSRTVQPEYYESAEIKVFENASMKADMIALGLGGNPTIKPARSFGFSVPYFVCDNVTNLYVAPVGAPGVESGRSETSLAWDLMRLFSFGLLPL